MKQKQVYTILLSLLLLLTVFFIWNNSMESIPESAERSQGIMELLAPYLEWLVGQGNVSNHLVRKLAHFAEFALLGVELMLLARIWGKRSL